MAWNFEKLFAEATAQRLAQFGGRSWWKDYTVAYSQGKDALREWAQTAGTRYADFDGAGAGEFVGSQVAGLQAINSGSSWDKVGDVASGLAKAGAAAVALYFGGEAIAGLAEAGAAEAGAAGAAEVGAAEAGTAAAGSTVPVEWIEYGDAVDLASPEVVDWNELGSAWEGAVADSATENAELAGWSWADVKDAAGTLTRQLLSPSVLRQLIAGGKATPAAAPRDLSRPVVVGGGVPRVNAAPFSLTPGQTWAAAGLVVAVVAVLVARGK